MALEELRRKQYCTVQAILHRKRMSFAHTQSEAAACCENYFQVGNASSRLRSSGTFCTTEPMSVGRQHISQAPRRRSPFLRQRPPGRLSFPDQYLVMLVPLQLSVRESLG